MAQFGRLAIQNTSVLPSASLADGRKEYAEPMAMELAGVPPIVGERLEPLELADIENVGSETVVCPSLTLIRILLHLPEELGEPLRMPRSVVKEAQLGLFAIEKRILLSEV